MCASLCDSWMKPAGWDASDAGKEARPDRADRTGINRRDFIALVGSAVAWPRAARAQQGVKRLGILLGGTEDDFRVLDKLINEELAHLGWVEGRNLRVDLRAVGSNDPGLILPHAEGLVRSAPDIIYATPATAVQVLQRLTSSIPIVFVQNSDPVQAGAVQSLAHPGGNMTGFLGFEPSINSKLLQLLKDIAPRMTRVGVLQTAASQAARGGSDFAAVAEAAGSFGIMPVALVVRDDAADIERVIVSFAQQPDGGLILPPDGIVARHHALVAQLAIKFRMPSVGYFRQFVDAGGLLYYAAAPFDPRRVAGYIDRILRGEKPANLPVVTPDKFNLVINLKTATALGLTIPPSLFALADEVVE
jgi:putative ABC transport system substrate-binding protein